MCKLMLLKLMELRTLQLAAPSDVLIAQEVLDIRQSCTRQGSSVQ